MRKFKIDATCRHVSARVSGRWKKVSLPTSLHFSELAWRHPRWPSFLKSPIKITQSAPEILSAPTDHTWDSYLDMRHNCFLLWASLASSKSLWAFLTWAGADSVHRDNGNGLIFLKKSWNVFLERFYARERPVCLQRWACLSTRVLSRWPRCNLRSPPKKHQSTRCFFFLFLLMLLLKSEVCELELTLLMRRSEDVTLLGQPPLPSRRLVSTSRLHLESRVYQQHIFICILSG